MNFSGLNYFDYSYLILLFLFAVFFGIKGATKSISYSLKIILSISLPFIFYKRVLNFSLEKLNIEYLFSLQTNNAIFLEIISFIFIFLITYIIYSILEKALNLKSPTQIEFKILDTIIGSIYGIILFSFIFYFSYIAFFKNYIDEKKKPSDDEDSKKKKIDDSSSASKDSKKGKKSTKKNKKSDN